MGGSFFYLYQNIRKIAAGEGDDYTTGSLLNYPYFKENDKFLAIDSSKQQVLDVHVKVIQQINFTGNLGGAENTTILFFLGEVKETILDFSKGTAKVSLMCSVNLFWFDIIPIQDGHNITVQN